MSWPPGTVAACLRCRAPDARSGGTGRAIFAVGVLRDADVGEFAEEAEIVGLEATDVVDAVLHHDDPLDAEAEREPGVDRKSTRLNSSHVKISYAVFCL